MVPDLLLWDYDLPNWIVCLYTASLICSSSSLACAEIFFLRQHAHDWWSFEPGCPMWSHVRYVKGPYDGRAELLSVSPTRSCSRQLPYKAHSQPPWILMHDTRQDGLFTETTAQHLLTEKRTCLGLCGEPHAWRGCEGVKQRQNSAAMLRLPIVVGRSVLQVSHCKGIGQKKRPKHERTRLAIGRHCMPCAVATAKG